MKKALVLVAVMAIAFMGCKKDKSINLTEESTSLYHQETYQIPATCVNPITYSSENEYHATVSSEGLVTAQFVGSTTILLQSEGDSKSFTVNVMPKSNLYTEPNITFGETKDAVIARLGTPAVSQDDAIGYAYASPVDLLMVMFDDYNRVSGYALVLPDNYSSELKTFVEERYDYVMYSEGIYIYRNALTNSATTMIIGVGELDEDYCMVLYVPNDGGKSMDSYKALLKALEI